MTWLRASLYTTFPGVTSIPLLELADQITISRHKIQIQMVALTPAGPAVPPPTYIIQIQPAFQAAPAKKKDPEKGRTYKPLPCTDLPTYRYLKTFPRSGRPWPQ